MRLLIKNAWICNAGAEPAKRDVLVENGVISEISEKIEMDVLGAIDAAGLYVVPGLIDMYCKVGEPGYEHEEDIISASKSAARGGFTSITCLPVTKPVIDNRTVVDYINIKSRALSIVNIFPYGSMTIGCKGEKLAEIGQMIRAGVVAVSDGGISIADASLMRKILRYSGMFDIPVITMCEDKSLAGHGMMNRGEMSTKIGILAIPREAEETMVARNILLSHHNHSRLHITHVTTSGSTDIIMIAKKAGMAVTCETSPHYFSLSEDIVESYNTLAKVTPPLRAQDDIARIKQGLVDGTIDVISSGHVPTTIENKDIEFERAAYGISSLETAFCVSYTELVEKKVLSIGDLVAKMSRNPANILGLENKGEIKEGFDADMMIFDDKNRFTVNASEFASKAKFSPYDGREMVGEVRFTIVNGKVVYLK